MSTLTAGTTGVRFGGYRFDLGSGRLWSGAREVRLTPKASGVLKTLVTRAGDPVAKEELFAAVWTDTVVSDDALTSCVQELRKALEDDARRPRFIETRHRRGYRFVAPLAPAPAAPDPPLPEAAYEHYLRGRQLLPRMTPAALATSAEMFERAIAIDAGYGPAWAGLAMAQATLYEWFGADENLLAAAIRASEQALALTPGLADAHVARGFALTLSGRHDEAACEFEVAIHLNPSLFDAYYYFARASFGRGDIARSATLFTQAAHVRPEDFQSPILLSQSLDMLGRGAEATAARREGIARAERLLALNPLDARALSLGANALCDDGQAARAMEWSRRALDLQPEDPCVQLNAVCLYAHLGLKAEALTLMERVFARGCGKRDWVEHDPDYDSLRAEPRFQALLARLK